jgi:hypothetical protein
MTLLTFRSAYLFREKCSFYREGRPEVVETPGDDNIVVAAHQHCHHARPVPHPGQGRVHLHHIIPLVRMLH